MKALITGASGGIGRDMATILSHMGYELILVARNEKKLVKLSEEINTSCQLIVSDLSVPENCRKLYETVSPYDIDILINNAGYGLFGEFDEIDLEQELNMIDLNIKATDILTKLFLADFKRKNSGYILNVASAASFAPGPLMSSYYASKAYVLRLTQAVYEELHHEKSGVHVCVLCPGPVNTNFSERAGVKFAIDGMKSYDVASYAISGMFRGKLVIVPGFKIKAAHLLSKLIPDKLILKFCYHLQRRKT